MSTADEQRVPGDLPLWEIPGWRERFGVVAGITGRGDPEAPFDLGLWSAQPVGEVMGRWRRLRAAFPAIHAMSLAHQVHGDRVLRHEAPPEGWTIFEGADGHVSATAGHLLTITVADCVPVYLVAPQQRAIGLLHAGWRGTATGILARGVERLCTSGGARATDIVMHAGVCISGPRYQVGSEVMAALGEPMLEPGPWQVDLRAVLVKQARALGLSDITASTRCTATEGTEFFSHRASSGADGRMVAYLGMIPQG